jgi:hypothetical protein
MPTQGAVDLSAAGAGSLTGKTSIAGPDVAIAYSSATSGSAATADINVSANTKTLIDWSSFTVAAGNAVNFHFSGNAGTANGQIVINRVQTAATKIDIEGSVNGVQGASGPSGFGNIWFLDNSGIIVNGTISAHDVFLSTGSVDLDTFFKASSYTGALAAVALTSTQSLIDIDNVPTAFSASLDPATGDVLLTASAGGVGVKEVVAGRDVVISAPSDVKVRDAAALGDITVISTGGSASVRDLDTASGDITVKGATGAVLKAAALFSGATHHILVETTSSGDAVLGNTGPVNSNSVITNEGGGQAFVTVQALGGSGNAYVGLESADLSGGHFGTVSSAGGDASFILGTGGASLDAFGGANLFVDLPGTFSVANSPSVNGDYTATAGGFGANALNPTTAPNNFTIEDTSTSLSAGNLKANDTLSVTVDSGGFTASNLSAGSGEVLVNATGDIKLTSASAGLDVDIASVSGGAAKVGSATAGTDITVQGDTGATLGAASLTGDNSAVRHLIVTSTGGPAILGAASASAITSSNHVTTVSSSTNTDVEVTSKGPTGTGDALVYLHDASSSSGSAPLEIDVLTSAHSDAAAVLTAGSGPAADLRVAAVKAGRDIALGSGAGSVFVTTDEGGTGNVDAGDDVAIRAKKGVSIDGAISSGQGSQGVGAADAMASSTPLTAFGHAYTSLTDGSHIDVAAGTGGVTFVGAAIATGGDIRIQATGAFTAPSLQAGRDVLLDVGAVNLSANPVTAGADIAVASTADVFLGDVSAGDDVAIRAPGSVTISGALTSGTSSEAVGSADYLAASTPMKAFGHTYSSLTDGSHVDVISGSAGTHVSGAIVAHHGDIRIQTSGAVAALSLQADRDILLDVGQVNLATRLVTAGADVAVKSTGDVAIGAVTAGDDVAIRTSGSVTVGGDVTSGTSGESVGAADYLAGSTPLIAFGHTYSSLTDGSHIDIVSGSGGAHATGNMIAHDGDIRIQTTGAVGALSLYADRDILLDVGQVNLATRLVTAGADIAIKSSGDVALGAVGAGDDIAIRTHGAVMVDGVMTSGLSGEALGAADYLVGWSGQAMTAFGHTYSSLTDGSHIDITAGLGGAQFGAAVIAKGGDIRIQTPGAVTAPSLQADRDVLLDAGTIFLTITAGGDVALKATGDVNVGAVSAGDDVAIRTPGAVVLHGDLTSGTSGESVGAADYLAANAPMTAFGHAYSSLADGRQIDIAAGFGGVEVDGDINAKGGDIRIQTPGAVTAPSLLADRDVLLDVGAVNLTVSPVTAGGDVAIKSSGEVAIGAVSAGDDITIRTPGTVTIGGSVTSGTSGETIGAADYLAASAPLIAFGHTYSSLTDGSHIDIGSGPGGMQAAGDVVAHGGDIRIQSTGAVSANSLQADRDILLDVVQVGLAGRKVSAGADVAIRSAIDVALGDVSAGDDVAIRTPGSVTLSGALTSGTSSESVGAADYLTASVPMTAFGHAYSDPTDGRHIDIVAGSGGVNLVGAVVANSGDIRIQTPGAVTAPSLKADRDVLLDVGAVNLTTSPVTAGADVAVVSTGNVWLGAVSAGDDVAIRGLSVTIGGALTSGTSGDSVGAADYLASVFPMAPFGRVYTDLTDGRHIDITAAGLNVSGAVTANGGDIRIQTSGAVTAPSLQANRDVVLDVGVANLTTSSVTAGADIAVMSLGAANFGSLSAGDDVEIRAGSVTVAGAMTSGTSGEAFGAADDLAAFAPLNVFGHTYSSLTDGSHIDIMSGSAGVQVGSDVTAHGGDIRIQTTGAVSALSLQADRDILLDVGQVNLATRLVTAGADIAIKSSGDVTLGDVTAGDDVAIRTPGAVALGGSLTSGTVGEAQGAADYLAASVPMTAFGHSYSLLTDGSHIDITAGLGGVQLGGAVKANGGDIGVQTPGALAAVSLSGDRDVLLDTGAVNLTASPVTAGADVAIRSSGAVALGAVSAGDDVAIRGFGSVTIGGALTSGTAGDSVGAADYLATNVPMTAFGHVYSDLTDGRHIDITAGSGGVKIKGAAIANNGDIRIQTTGSVTAPSLQAGRDVLLDVGLVNMSGNPLTAGADVAVKSSGSVALGSVSAGDDVAIRSSDAVTLTGALNTGTADESVGAADYLIGSSGQAMVAFGHTYSSLADGAHIDIIAGAGGVQSNGNLLAHGGDIRIQTPGAVLAPSLQADRDVLLDVGAVNLTVSPVTAGADVAVKSTGDVALGAVSAGDDVAIRTPGSVTLSGALSSGGAGESVGAADYLIASSGQAMTAFGHTFSVLTDGGHVDIKAGAAGLVLDGDVVAKAGDIRIQTPGSVTAPALQAGRDVLFDTGAISQSGLITAGADVALKSTGDIVLGAVTAGDDAAIRTPGSLTLTGALTSGASGEATGAADYLITSSGQAMTAFGHVYGTLTDGSHVDVIAGSGGVQLGGDVDANGGDIRIQTPGSLTAVSLQADRDVLLDTGAISQSGSVVAGADVAIKSSGAIAAGAVSAGDDVAIRTPGSLTLTGAVTSGTGSEATGAADYLITSSGQAMTAFGHVYGTLTDGSHVDVIAGSGGVQLGGDVVANGGDIRVQTPGALTAVSLQAGRDVLFDTGAISQIGAITAGADVAMKSSGDISAGAVSAGDDVAIRTPVSLTLTGALTSGVSVEAMGAADYLITSSGQSMTAFGHNYGALTDGSHIDVIAGSGGAQLGGAVVANGGDIRIQTPGSLTAVSLQAGRDVLFDTGAISQSGAITAGADVAVKSSGDVALGSVSAGDDVAMRVSGSLTLTGAMSSGASGETVGAADYLITSSSQAMTAFEHTYGTLTDGSHVDVIAGAGGAQFGGAVTANGGDIRIQTPGALTAVSLQASRDILFDTGAISQSGAITAGSDVAVKSSGDVALGSVSAGDDVAIRTPGSLTLTGALTSGASGEAVGAADYLITSTGQAMTAFEHAYPSLTDGSHVDVIAGSGGVQLGGAVTANGGDIRIQTPGSLTAVSLQAGRDVLLDTGAISQTGSITAAADVAVKSSGDVVLGAVSAGDDVAIRTPGSLTLTGSLTSGVSGETVGAADYLIGSAGQAMTVFGASYPALTDASHVDLLAGGAVSLQSVLAQGSGSDVRVQSLTGGVTTSDVTAGRDVIIDAALSVGYSASGDITAANNPIFAIGRDVAIWSHTGNIDLKSVEAGDDIALRAPAGVITALDTIISDGTGSDDASGAGDNLAGAGQSPILLFGSADQGLTSGGVIDIAAQQVSVRNAGGAAAAVAANGTVASDVRIVATNPDPGSSTQALMIGGGIVAGRDVALDASDPTKGGSVLTGAITAGRDIAVRALTGSLEIGSGQAGEDIVLRAQNNAVVDGRLSAGGSTFALDDASSFGDVLFNTDKTALNGAFDVLGSNVDVKTSRGFINVGGPTTAATDVRLQTDPTTDGVASAKSVSTGDITAGHDILLDGTSVGISGGSSALIATSGDIAVRARKGTVAFTSANAADDIVVRATGSVSAHGALTSGGGADGSGMADRLTSAAESGPMVFAGAPFDLTGGNVDIVSGGSIDVSGATTAQGSGSDVRMQASGSIGTSGLTAGRDVYLDSPSASGGDIGVGPVNAGRDIAIRAGGGSITIASASAGQDLVIRAKGQVSVAGALTAQGHVVASGPAAVLEGLDPISYLPDANTTDPVTTFSAAGSNIDVKGARISVGGQTTSAGDARFQATGAASFAGVTSPGTIFVRASSLTLKPGQAWTAPLIRIESTSADGLVLGDPPALPPGSPMRIDNATFGQFTGPSGGAARIELFAGDSSGSQRGQFYVGDLTVKDQNRIGEIDLYAGGTNAVRITGAFVPDTNGDTKVVIGSTVAANIWTPDSILVLNDGDAGPNRGSIGSATITAPPLGFQTISDVLAFKSVELNAVNNILMGSTAAPAGGGTDFIDQMSAASQSDLQTLLRQRKDQDLVSGGPVMFLAAGSLTIRANGRVIQQNTSGYGSGYYTGAYLTGAGDPSGQLLSVGRIDGASASGDPVPNNFEMFLSLVDGTTTYTGQAASLSHRIGFTSNLAPSQFFRVNYCVIATIGNCTPVSLPTLNIQPAKFDLSNLLSQGNLQDIEDPTVTGAANEEIWRKPE